MNRRPNRDFFNGLLGLELGRMYSHARTRQPLHYALRSISSVVWRRAKHYMSGSNDFALYKPRVRTADSVRILERFARALITASAGDGGAAGRGSIDVLLDAALADQRGWVAEDRAAMEAGVRVLADLARQGWRLEVAEAQILLRPPAEHVTDPTAEKDRIRRQELLKRQEQLATPAARKFVAEMERFRAHRNELVSVSSLFRDGRALAAELRAVRSTPPDRRHERLAAVIDPYLVFFDSEDCCPFTGLRLMDVWRYFRHTWANQYTSVPGRTMMFLVRDRAAAKHPVVGIGALSSPVVQIRERDIWIGWHPETLLQGLKERPSPDMAVWLRRTVEQALQDIYVSDFLHDGGSPLLSNADLAAPTPEVIDRLRAHSKSRRELHEQSVAQAGQESDADNGTGNIWERQARSHLFASKRALALADLLEARLTFDQFLGEIPDTRQVAELVADRRGQRSVLKVARKAKADRVGVAVADISVCGAIAPYGPLLGGKLVSMLAASPEVVEAYRARYGQAVSEIASKMAGRPIVRPADLVFLGTTSLYGRSSQYNRVRVPGERLGGEPGSELRYVALGESEGVGTSHYHNETIRAIDRVVDQSRSGRRVNYIFGEGSSPKMRKLREGLTAVGFPADLIRHHRRREVFGVPLISNLRDYLLGVSDRPSYVCTMQGPAATAAIVTWWRERWLASRIESDEVLSAVQEHVIGPPVSHGARVQLPPDGTTQLNLFGDQ
jgi:hypothetical protein